MMRRSWFLEALLGVLWLGIMIGAFMSIILVTIGGL